MHRTLRAMKSGCAMWLAPSHNPLLNIAILGCCRSHLSPATCLYSQHSPLSR